jgi:hypothetical protein
MKFFRLLLALVAFPLLSQAQTIGLNQVVAAEFNSVAEFQTLSSQGWIFRPGSGTGTATCATPGDMLACGFGFTNDGAFGVARGRAQSNPEGRWIVTPPIIFGSSGTVTFVLRKAASGQGGLDVRESGGGSDTQDMAKPGIDGVVDPNRGSTPCAPGTGSFCPERTIRSSGPATSGNEPSCANLFGAGSDGVGLSFCTVVIRATELQNFGTGLHRLAFKLRSTTAANPNYQDMLLDRIVISTGNNDVLPAQAFVANGTSASTLQRGLSRHPILSWSAATILPVGATADVANRMDFAPDNTLYGIATVGGPARLVRINPLDASVTSIADLSGFLVTGEFAQSFSIDPLSGQAIVIGRNFTDLQSRLYYLDLATAELTLQAGINNGNDFKASAISIDCQGRLFAVETTNPSGSGRLYRMDRVTGNVTLLGNTSYLSSIAHGPIDFDNASGRLYGWVTAQSGAYTGYGSYALNTGTFGVLANTPSALITGGAFSSQCWAAFRSGFEN